MDNLISDRFKDENGWGPHRLYFQNSATNIVSNPDSTKKSSVKTAAVVGAWTPNWQNSLNNRDVWIATTAFNTAKCAFAEPIPCYFKQQKAMNIQNAVIKAEDASRDRKKRKLLTSGDDDKPFFPPVKKTYYNLQNYFPNGVLSTGVDLKNKQSPIFSAAKSSGISTDPARKIFSEDEIEGIVAGQIRNAIDKQKSAPLSKNALKQIENSVLPKASAKLREIQKDYDAKIKMGMKALRTVQDNIKNDRKTAMSKFIELNRDLRSALSVTDDRLRLMIDSNKRGSNRRLRELERNLRNLNSDKDMVIQELKKHDSSITATNQHLIDLDDAFQKLPLVAQQQVIDDLSRKTRDALIRQNNFEQKVSKIVAENGANMDIVNVRLRDLYEDVDETKKQLKLLQKTPTPSTPILSGASTPRSTSVSNITSEELEEDVEEETLEDGGEDVDQPEEAGEPVPSTSGVYRPSPMSLSETTSVPGTPSSVASSSRSTSEKISLTDVAEVTQSPTVKEAVDIIKNLTSDELSLMSITPQNQKTLIQFALQSDATVDENGDQPIPENVQKALEESMRSAIDVAGPSTLLKKTPQQSLAKQEESNELLQQAKDEYNTQRTKASYVTSAILKSLSEYNQNLTNLTDGNDREEYIRLRSMMERGNEILMDFNKIDYSPKNAAELATYTEQLQQTIDDIEALYSRTYVPRNPAEAFAREAATPTIETSPVTPYYNADTTPYTPKKLDFLGSPINQSGSNF